MHKGTNDFIDQLFSLGLYPLIDRPSRITTSSATLIDNIFTNQSNCDTCNSLLINDISDHLPVFSISKPKLERKCTNKLINIRMTNQENISSFKQQLAKQTWEDVYKAENVHEAYYMFIKKIVNLYNVTCPAKKVKVVSECNKNKPWITTGLKNACKKKKNQLYLKFLRTRNDETDTRYKRYKNKLTSILRRCESDYYNNLLEVQIGNIKETWKILNGIIKKTQDSHIVSRYIYA